MNKYEYMEKLLQLCTEKQTDLFSRMYPNKPTPKQIGWAIKQLENTLRGLNCSKAELAEVKNKHEVEITELQQSLHRCSSLLKDTQADLAAAEKKIERLGNPINIINNEVQERLDLLDALEAGGVDNWSGYDYAVHGDS